MRVVCRGAAIITSQTKMSSTQGDFAANQRAQLSRQFYCGARNVPENIVTTVLRQMGDKWKTLDPNRIASLLFNEQVLTHDDYYQLSNIHIPPGERINNLVITVLPHRRGDQRNLLATFYHCLLKAGYPDLAREVQQRALVQCSIDSPILAPENVCGINPAKTLEGMVNKLNGKQVSPQLANEFRVCLRLDDSDVPADQTDLGIISNKWILKNTASCSPEALVEALVLTPGLGKFASGIGCPNNPHEARSWFLSLQDKWWDVAYYLGYTKDDIEGVESEMDKNPEAQIQKFLAIFQMPDCGAKTMPVLHKLGDLSGVAEVRKKPVHYSMHPDLHKIDHAAKKELASAKGYPVVSLPWYPGQSSGKLACSWVPHSMAVQPYMPAPHFNIAFLPWDMSFGGTEICTDPQYLIAQQASIESSHAETLYHRQTSQQSVDGEDLVASDPPSLKCRKETISTAEDISEAAPNSQPDSLPAAAESCFVTTSEQQNPGNSLYAPVEIIQVPEDNAIIQNCKDPDAVDIVKGLLNSGASLHIKSRENGFHPIHLAVLSGSLEMINLILSKVPETIDSVTDEHHTPVMIACLKKYIDCVKLLVEKGADVTAKDCNGFSCLHLQHTLECPAIVSFLVEKGAVPVDFPTDGDHLTALTRACLIGEQAYLSAEYLLTQNANPNGREEGQIRPLSAAAGSGCKQLIEILFANGADVDLKDKDGTTPLLRACKNKQIDAAVDLIHANASLNEVDENGESCVFAAVASDSTELLGVLIACGANVNMTKFIIDQETGGFQLTPLALASMKGNLEIVEMLVEAKANVNYTSALTIPAITFAVHGNRVAVVEYFLKLNEISKTLDGLGSAIEMAMKKRNQQMLKILLNALGGFEKVVHHAVEEGQERLAELLREVYEPDGQEKNSVCTGAASFGAEANGARDTAQLTRRQVQRSAENVLEEFVHVSVATLEKQKGKQYLIEKAQQSGNYVVAQFYQRYFDDPGSFVDVMKEFISGSPSPSEFIFNDPYFSGVAFKEILQEIGKLDLVEMTMLAFLHYPGIQDLAMENGADLFTHLFGERFYHQVEVVGLLNPAVIRPPEPSHPAQPPQQTTETQYTRSGATLSSFTPTTVQQNSQSQQGHTGRKVGKQQKESAEITSTTSFNTSQDHVQTDGNREQIPLVNGAPLDTHPKPPAPVERLQERDTRSGATLSSFTPTTVQQNSQSQQRHTGRKLGEKQKESAEITSTNSFSTSQDQVQTGGYREQTPLVDTHPKAPAPDDRLQGRELPPQSRGRQNRDKQLTSGHSGKSPRKLPRLPSSGQHHQSLCHSEPQQRTSSTQITPLPKQFQSPTSTRPVSTLARPNATVSQDEVRETSYQRMKQRGDPKSVAMLPRAQNTRLTTQRSISWSTNSSSSLDSTASDDVSSPNRTTKPQLLRQDTGYLSNPDDIGMQENQASGLMPESFNGPLDLRQEVTLELLKTLALLIPNWQKLAYLLGLEDQEIQVLEKNYTMRDERCFQMLKAWIQKEDGNASYAKLVEEFRKMQRQDLEPLIHQHVESLSKPKVNAIRESDAMKCEWTITVNTEAVKDNADNILGIIKSMLQQKYKTATIKVSLEK